MDDDEPNSTDLTKAALLTFIDSLRLQCTPHYRYVHTVSRSLKGANAAHTSKPIATGVVCFVSKVQATRTETVFVCSVGIYGGPRAHSTQNGHKKNRIKCRVCVCECKLPLEILWTLMLNIRLNVRIHALCSLYTSAR